MADKPPVPGPTLAEKRQKTIQLLIDSFASDRLSVEDFESRLDLAHRAGDVNALDEVTRDLVRPAPATAQAAPPATPPQARLARVRESQFFVAIMGGFERKGAWTPARRTRIFAFMGGAVLDFREANFGPGVTEIQLFTMMGGVEIIVPPGMAVDSGGIAIMGSFAHEPDSAPGTAADRAGTGQYSGSAREMPTIRVGGLAVMGGVEVHVRLPGESARDARRRARAERKRLRRGDPNP